MKDGKFKIADYKADTLTYRPDIFGTVMEAIRIIDAHYVITLLADV